MSDLIFKRDSGGKLRFVGDFERLYLNERDPWGQSGESGDSKMKRFYDESRNRLLHNLSQQGMNGLQLAEVGCGLGHVTDMLARNFPETRVVGFDSSLTAVSKASENFPNIHFESCDILTQPLPVQCEAILLSNILWYVIHDPSALINNIALSYPIDVEDCYFCVQNALFKSQQEYAADVITTVGDGLNFFNRQLATKFEIFSEFGERFVIDGGTYDVMFLMFHMRRK